MGGGGAANESMSEYRFPERLYKELCEFSRVGKLEEVKRILTEVPAKDRRRFGPETLAPNPGLHLHNPLVLAAQFGQLEVVKYLLENYRDVLNINRGATIISKTQKLQTHRVPPLVAACTSNNLALVQYLVSKGADLGCVSLTRATPLRSASYYGYLPIMEYLIELGIDINVPNCIGSSALLAAAYSGHVAAVKLLLDHGANRDQKTIEGYSVVHEAAVEGKSDVVKLLLDYGMSPQFSLPEPSNDNYVPCPLYLASSCGRQTTAELLMALPECPDSCKVDSYLLLGVYAFLMTGSDQDLTENWLKAFEMKNDLRLATPSLQPTETYAMRTEVSSLAEVQFVLLDRAEICYQCLLIRERCLGKRDRDLVECLCTTGTNFVHLGRYAEAEQLWKRAMVLEIDTSCWELDHPHFTYCFGIMKSFETDLNDFFSGLQNMVENFASYEADYPAYVRYGLTALLILEQARTKPDGEVISYDITLQLILQILAFWMKNSGAKMVSQDTLSDGCAAECTELGKELVGKYLVLSSQTTLIHLLLKCVEESELPLPYDMLLDHILLWGGSKCINMPDSSGRRPIHTICSLSPSHRMHSTKLMAVLLSWQVHVDAANCKGESALGLSSGDTSSLLRNVYPLPLSCYASRSVVKGKVDHRSSGLPAHVVRLIQLHDPACAPVVNGYFEE